MMDTAGKKLKATQALFEEINELALQEAKVSLIASALFEKYFADEIAPEDANAFLTGNRRELQLKFKILLDHLLELEAIIHFLSAASCGKA